MNVLYCDTEGGYSYKIIGDAVKKYMPGLVGEEAFYIANHKKTEQRHIGNFIPDWSLTSTPLTNHSYAMKHYRNWLSVGWDLEGAYEWHRLRKDDSPHFHVLATVDPLAQKVLKRRGIETMYLPLGFDPLVYNHFEVPKEYESDVIIAGVMYPNRARWVKSLRPLGKDIKIRTINCKHWEERIRDCKSFIAYYHPDTIPVDELVKYYCGAKIIIVGNRDFDPNNDHKHHGISSLAIGRIFQETACKRLVMVDNTRPNLKEHFILNKEIVVFNDEDDLREKVMYYLRNEGEREKIAQAGYERTMKENTYFHRLATLNNFINQNYERFRQQFKFR